MRFIHAADLHLGAGFRSRPEIGEQLQARHRQAWGQLIQQAVDQQVDAVLLAGDLLDTSDPGSLSWSAQSTLLRGLRQLDERGIRVFIAPGDHDPAGPRSVYRRMSWPGNVTVFDSSKPEAVPLGGTEPPAVVHGVGFDRGDVRENLALLLTAPADECFHVAVLHCQVSGAAGSERHGEYAACKADDLRGRGIHYWALGHIHQPISVIDDPGQPLVARYAGSAFPLDVSESGIKGCWLVEVDAERQVKVNFLPLATVRWEQIRVDVAAEDDLAAVESRITGRIRDLQLAGVDLCLRLVVTGRTMLPTFDPRWQEVFRAVKAEHELLHLDVRNELRPAVDLDQYADQPHVLGHLIARYRKLARAPRQDLGEVLGEGDVLLRPTCEERVMAEAECADYQQRVLEQAMDLLAGRLVEDFAESS